MMTKKNYVAIADIIACEYGLPHKSEYINAVKYGISTIALALADYFESENPQFDRSRFLKACGLEE